MFYWDLNTPLFPINSSNLLKESQERLAMHAFFDFAKPKARNTQTQKSEKLHVFKNFFKCFTLLKFTASETMINILFLKLKFELSKKSLD